MSQIKLCSVEACDRQSRQSVTCDEKSQMEKGQGHSVVNKFKVITCTPDRSAYQFSVACDFVLFTNPVNVLLVRICTYKRGIMQTSVGCGEAKFHIKNF